ncbi:MAG: hypothetical protein KKC05_00150, partial [Nanoarchaeota archaeon]|nr:hypothetical protein [Nanoarchaeota archaeon]
MKGLLVMFIFVSLVFTLYTPAANAQCIACQGSGCSGTNNCPKVGQSDYLSTYYDISGGVCTDIVTCGAGLECNAPGTQTCQSVSVDPGCLSFNCIPVDVVCANSASSKDPTGYGWWVRGDIPDEGTVGINQCNDGIDNDCDGGCDEFGCGIMFPEWSCDSVPPISSDTLVSGTPGTNGWYTSDVRYTLSCDDESRSGCIFVGYCVGSVSCSPTTPYFVPIDITTEGSNHLKYYARDNAGNEETPIHDIEVKIDKTDPVTTETLT